jgi:hypothetical protein
MLSSTLTSFLTREKPSSAFKRYKPEENGPDEAMFRLRPGKVSYPFHIAWKGELGMHVLKDMLAG